MKRLESPHPRPLSRKRARGACVEPLALLLVGLLAIVLLPSVIRAEEEEIRTTRLSVAPAEEPREALKHLLLPSYLDRKPGNAAINYHRAILMAKGERFSKDQESVAQWLEVPLGQLPLVEAKRLLDGYDSVLGEVTLGTRCEQCDWQLPLREGNPIAVLLPEIQEMRALARLVGLKARVAIAEGKTDEAVRWLQVGFAMGRHVAEAPLLINGLVGIAICNIMCDRVGELVERPDGPNLYWSLAALPRPPIDLLPAFEMEMHMVYLMFPALRNVGTEPRSPEFWRAFLDQMGEQAGLWVPGAPKAEQWRAMVAGLATVGYPRARASLIEEGRSPQEVDAMPVAQVVMLYTAQTFNELRDRMFKWFALPYWQAEPGIRQAEDYLRTEGRKREIVPLASLLLPAVSAAKAAEARGEREIALLRIVEALRIHAARHGGQLPERLEEVTDVPLPIDPFTGKSFVYRRDGAKAVLESLTDGKNKHLARRFEITIRQPVKQPAEKK